MRRAVRLPAPDPAHQRSPSASLRRQEPWIVAHRRLAGALNVEIWFRNFDAPVSGQVSGLFSGGSRHTPPARMGPGHERFSATPERACVRQSAGIPYRTVNPDGAAGGATTEAPAVSG